MNILLVNNDSDTWKDLVGVVTGIKGWDVAQVHHSQIKVESARQYDLAILSGGWWYDDEVALLSNYAEELAFIKHAPIPILGICIGMQLMHVALDQAVPLIDIPQTGDQHITINKKGREIFGFGEDLEVYKNHTRGVIEADPDFEVLATSPGHIEIMKHKTKPLLGVQFHPEVGPIDNARDMILTLVSAVIKKSNNQR